MWFSDSDGPSERQFQDGHTSPLRIPSECYSSHSSLARCFPINVIRWENITRALKLWDE